MNDKIKAPWSKELVDRLNQYQKCNRYHPYTCGYCRDKHGIRFIKDKDGNLIKEPFDFPCYRWPEVIILGRELVATEK